MAVLERDSDLMAIESQAVQVLDINSGTGHPLQSSKDLKHGKNEMMKGFSVMLKPRGPICNLD